MIALRLLCDKLKDEMLYISFGTFSRLVQKVFTYSKALESNAQTERTPAKFEEVSGEKWLDPVNFFDVFLR